MEKRKEQFVSKIGKVDPAPVRCLFDKMVPLAELKSHPKNRNEHPKEQIIRLAQILSFQGWRYPVKVSKQSGYVTSGHGRILAAKANGWDSVPVNYQNYDTDEQEYADVQADNAIASWAELNLSEINRDLADLGPDFNVDLLGIHDFVIEPIDKLTPQSDQDDSPEPPSEPVSKRGDVYALGRHRVCCGDATVLEDYQKVLGDKKADMVLTDPPYNVDYTGRSKKALKIENDKMDGDSFFKFLYDFYTNLLISTKPGGSIYVAHADIEGANFRKAMTEAGWLLKQCLVWVKHSLVMGRQDYQWKHEPILYGWAPGESHNWYSDRKQTTVLEFDRPSRNADHPTMKPVALFEYLLSNSSRPSEIVFDSFLGSGTTLIACEKAGRTCYGLELDPRYVDVIVARWEKYTGKKAELLTGDREESDGQA